MYQIAGVTQVLHRYGFFPYREDFNTFFWYFQCFNITGGCPQFVLTHLLYQHAWQETVLPMLPQVHVGSLLTCKHDAVPKLPLLHAQVFLHFCFFCTPKGLSACLKACSRQCCQSCYPCLVTRAAFEYSESATQSMFSAATYSACIDCSLHQCTTHYTIHCTIHYTIHCTIYCTIHCTIHYNMHYTIHCTKHCTMHYTMHSTGHCTVQPASHPGSCVAADDASTCGGAGPKKCVVPPSSLCYWMHPLWSLSCMAGFVFQSGDGSDL